MGLFGKNNKPQTVPTPRVVPPPRQPQGPSMEQALHNAEMRTGNLDARVTQLDQQIANFKREMQRSRPGTPTYNMYKRKALHAMRQRKSLESRAAMSANTAFNMEQLRDAKAMQQDNVAMVEGLRQANQELRAGSHQVNLDEVEDLRDDVADQLADVNEVGEVLGRSYDVDNVDEYELEQELEELEEDSVSYATGENLNAPSYLTPQDPTPYTAPQTAPSQGAPAQGAYAQGQGANQVPSYPPGQYRQ